MPCGLRLWRFVPASSTSQIGSDGYNAYTFEGSPEQGAEMPVIAGEKMTAIRVDGGEEDRLIFCG